MIKALPLVVVYATGPLLQWGLTLLTDGAPDWLPLADAALFAVVLLIVGLRMDRAALIDVAPEGGSRFRTLINAYGLENFSARLTALLTPVLVVLAVVSAFQGGDVSFPNVDPSQLSRR
jgi:preprotein translocase subunit SecG